MTDIAFDTETYPIYQSGKATKDVVPRMVCMSWSGPSGADVDNRYDGITRFLEWAADPDVRFVALNAVFDLAVMGRALMEDTDMTDNEVMTLLFNLLEDERVIDIGIVQRLHDISKGGLFIFGYQYNLAAMTKRHLNIVMGGKKKDGPGPDIWRLRYNELDDVPVSEWPKDAYEYALDDAVYTRDVWQRMKHHANHKLQVCADWSLHLMSAWGVLTDEAWTQQLDDFYAQQEHEHRTFLQQPQPLMPEEIEESQRFIRPDGTASRAAKRWLIEESFDEIGEPPWQTDKGNTKTDAKTLKYLEEKGVQNEAFAHFTKYNRAVKFRGTYLGPILDAGAGPLCPRFNVLVDSGRTSSSGPNVQNFPARTNPEIKAQLEARFGDEIFESDDNERVFLGAIHGPDIRGCFVPRPGCVYVAADYAAIEMAALAQVMRNITGQITPLGDAINKGMDLHVVVAAQLMGISYEACLRRVEEGDADAKQMRQISKIANYGFAGGASAETFREFAKGFGVQISSTMAARVKKAWEEAWASMPGYFRWVSYQKRGSKFHMEQHGPNRVTRGWRLRKTNRFTSAANTMFQGLCADGMKYACWLLAKECYTDKDSVLYGCRPVLMIHDELVIEAPAEKAEAAGQRLSEIMVAAMKVFIPDIQVVAEPEVMEERWAK